MNQLDESKGSLRPLVSRSLTIAALFLAVGCGGGGGGGGAGNPNAVVGSVDFAAFASDQIQNNTRDDIDPVEINGANFTGLQNEDPTTFDQLLSSTP